MREILFRGKKADDGEWVYGYLSKGRLQGYKGNSLRPCIDREEKGVMISSVVDPETVGQYTGLRDKNGIPIYEGDIVEAWSEGSHANFEVRWRQEGLPCWILYPNGKFNQLWKLHGSKHVSGFFYDTVEIVGNIHDKPELLNQEN